MPRLLQAKSDQLKIVIRLLVWPWIKCLQRQSTPETSSMMLRRSMALVKRSSKATTGWRKSQTRASKMEVHRRFLLEPSTCWGTSNGLSCRVFQFTLWSSSSAASFSNLELTLKGMLVGWLVSLPAFIASKPGFIQAYVICGATPMLLGRPVLEHFGTSRPGLVGGPWLPIQRRCSTSQAHGWRAGHVQVERDSVWPSKWGWLFEGAFFGWVHFGHEGRAAFWRDDVCGAASYDRSWGSFLGCRDGGMRERCDWHWAHSAVSSPFNVCGSRPRFSWPNFKKTNGMILMARGHRHPRRKLVWEVYAGEARLSQAARRMGAELKKKSTASRLLDELEPDEVFLSPKCTLWSQMQNANLHPD